MIAIINAVISAVGTVLNALLLLLPDSPFETVSGINADILQALNYFIPVNAMLAHLELYLVAVTAYYIVRVALRWVNAIQ